MDTEAGGSCRCSASHHQNAGHSKHANLRRGKGCVGSEREKCSTTSKQYNCRARKKKALPFPTPIIVRQHFLLTSRACAGLVRLQQQQNPSRQKPQGFFCCAACKFKTASPLSCNVARHGGEAICTCPQGWGAGEEASHCLPPGPRSLPASPGSLCEAPEEQRAHTYGNERSGSTRPWALWLDNTTQHL